MRRLLRRLSAAAGLFRRHGWRRSSRLLALLLLGLGLPVLARAQGPNRAGVVVMTGDGRVHSACVTFDEPAIDGLTLLERSGLALSVQPQGGNASVCSIAGEGCGFPKEDCFCQCKGGAACRYWTYWHLVRDRWQFSAAGAPTYEVKPGSVDGWAWGDGSVTSGMRPPVVTFENICPVPATQMPARSIVLPSATADLTTEPASAPPAPTAVPEQGASKTGQYLLFGGALAGLLAAMAVVSRRRG